MWRERWVHRDELDRDVRESPRPWKAHDLALELLRQVDVADPGVYGHPHLHPEVAVTLRFRLIPAALTTSVVVGA